MRSILALLVCCSALLATAPPATAADTGTIVGRVVNATKDRPQPNVRVTLTGSDADGSNRIARTVVTDARGRYRFDDLATGEERVYVIDATFQDGFFPSRALSLPADTQV